MVEVSFTQHSGKADYAQQDAIWSGERSFQKRDLPTSTISLDKPVFVAIADGVAVSPQPHLASLFVVERLAKLVESSGLNSRTVRNVHADLCNRFAQGRTLGSSTTLVAAYLSDDWCQIVNVGDSRAYLIRADGSFVQMSRDHTVINDLRTDDLASEDIEYASFYDALAECLIADHNEDQFLINQTRCQLGQNDSILLCSDGVHDVLGSESLRRLYSPSLGTHSQVEIWRNAVLKAGAADNFSMILFRLVSHISPIAGDASSHSE